MTHHTYAGRRAALAASAGALALVATTALTACSSDASDRSEAAAPHGGTSASSSSSSPSSAAPAAPAEETPAPLVLSSSTVRSTACVASRTRDFAWFEVQWQANADLDSFSVHLEDAHGVKAVGAALTVPPANFGGRIDYSGSVTWAKRALVGRSNQVTWIQRSTVFASSPTQDETGLLVLHLRFDGGPAEIGGLGARYATEDGAHGTAQVAVPEKWRFVRHGCA